MTTDELTAKLKSLAERGITTSVVYGPCGTLGDLFSVNVLTKDGESFEKPMAANFLEQCVDIAEIECTIRGWL